MNFSPLIDLDFGGVSGTIRLGASGIVGPERPFGEGMIFSHLLALGPFSSAAPPIHEKAFFIEFIVPNAKPIENPSSSASCFSLRRRKRFRRLCARRPIARTSTTTKPSVPASEFWRN